MAQHIGVRILDHNRETVLDKSADINFAPLQKLLFDKGKPKKQYPLLSGIDEYGNTFFNRVQIGQLLNELDMLSQEATTQEQKKTVSGVKKIAKICQSKVHHYLEFVGD